MGLPMEGKAKRLHVSRRGRCLRSRRWRRKTQASKLVIVGETGPGETLILVKVVRHEIKEGQSLERNARSTSPKKRKVLQSYQVKNGQVEKVPNSGITNLVEQKVNKKNSKSCQRPRPVQKCSSQSFFHKVVLGHPKVERCPSNDQSF